MALRDVPGDMYSYIFILVLLNSHTSSEVFPGEEAQGEGGYSKRQELTPRPLPR